MNNDADFLGLRGRVCVVTGAGSGIGRGIALAFARAGARVAILDLNAQGAEGTRAEAARLGADALVITCDTSDAEGVAAAAEACAAKFGPCDVLVNNAGVIRPGALDTLPLDLWNQVLAVNLTGYFLCAQVFGAQMRAKGRGALVHVASIAALEATAYAGAYSVAKAGVRMLSHQLAVEWGPHGIRSNAVHPGMVLTPMVQAIYEQPGVTERRSQAVPLGRVGQPDDIAQAVLFLASERAAYITGDDITVDGGFTQMLTSLVPRAGYERPAD
ncbi:MAG: SDR family oxidoreductase [Variovorax sp.]